jgi:hypothetical protein
MIRRLPGRTLPGALARFAIALAIAAISEFATAPLASAGVLEAAAAAPQPLGSATQATTSLLTATNLVWGAGSLAYDLSAPSPGTFSIQLSDLAYTDKFASLSASVRNGTDLLKQIDGSGEAAIKINTAGIYSLVVSYQTQSIKNPGLFSIDAQFVPAGAPIVGLPAGVWLLLSGLGGLLGIKGERRGGRMTSAPPMACA